MCKMSEKGTFIFSSYSGFIQRYIFIKNGKWNLLFKQTSHIMLKFCYQIIEKQLSLKV